mgnify:CR=1 FL=1|tara:strand:- start:8 stop:388 length:381 start_codon:yes stop_codon:yes gene_type:complete
MIREHIHKNIAGTAATIITNRYDQNNDYDVFSLILCNTHSEDSVYVDLYLQQTLASTNFVGKNGNWNPVEPNYKTVYIIKDLEITANNTLVLEKEEIEFDSTRYDFYIQLNASSSEVDLILNKTLN